MFLNSADVITVSYQTGVPTGQVLLLRTQEVGACVIVLARGFENK